MTRKQYCKKCDVILDNHDPHPTLCSSCSGDFSCVCETCKENKIQTNYEDGIYEEVTIP